jgi:Viral BACON domain/Putative binding domain, N-terminal
VVSFSAAVPVALARFHGTRAGVPSRQAVGVRRIGPCFGAIVVAAIAFLSASCGSSSETQTFNAPSDVRCSVRIDAEAATFPPSGGSGVLRLSTSRECAWTAKAEAPWVTLSSADGQGGGSVQFTVASNADAVARSTAITVNEQRVPIAQDGKPCDFSLSSTREIVDVNGGERIVQVRASAAQCSWTASTNASWITIASGREGRGDGTVRFRVESGAGAPRSGTVTIAGQRLQVEQGTTPGPGGPGPGPAPGCSYAISSDTFSVDPAGGDRQVAVSAAAGCAWAAESATPWITITSASSGSGPGVLGFRVAASAGPPRTGTFTIAGLVVTVVQSTGCAVSITPPTVNAAAGGGGAAIQVDTAPGCTWSAAADAPWIAVSGAASGSGPAQVNLAIAANVGPARTGGVTVTGQKVAVAQANGCTYGVSPDAQQIPPGGGPAAAAVTTATGCPWTASSGADWITMTTRTGSGAGQATFAVASNLGPARTGAVTIAGHSRAVQQASSCTWSFNPPSHELPAAGGFGTVLVFVSGPCTWTATSTVDWVRVVTGASGAGGGMVQFTIAANGGPPRTGVILIGGEKYLVNQHGVR